MKISNFKTYRPNGSYTPTDRQLNKIYNEVEAFLLKQDLFILKLFHRSRIKALAQIITEFAEDTYFEIDLWETLAVVDSPDDIVKLKES